MNTLQLKVIEMTDRRPSDSRSSERFDWSGFAEIDRAIAENRLTAYSWKKAWADPWHRNLTIACSACIVVVFGYLLGAGLHWW
jgi:hypothetical protein